MTENRKRTFDAITETIKIIALILGGLWAITTWQSNQTDQADAAKRELQKPFFEKQLSLYIEASKTAARLAYLKEHNKNDEAVEARFWESYWGELAFAESGQVEDLMVEVCKQYFNLQQCHDPQMRSAIELAHQASQEVESSWNVRRTELSFPLPMK
ncbi:MAG: hypothetical protein ACJ8AW_10605 [Rhodopila sp.]